MFVTRAALTSKMVVVVNTTAALQRGQRALMAGRAIIGSSHATRILFCSPSSVQLSTASVQFRGTAKGDFKGKRVFNNHLFLNIFWLIFRLKICFGNNFRKLEIEKSRKNVKPVKVPNHPFSYLPPNRVQNHFGQTTAKS